MVQADQQEVESRSGCFSGSLRSVDEAAFARAQRRSRVITAWLAGQTPTQIAEHAGVSRSMVAYIIAATPDLAQERTRREEAAAAELCAESLAWSCDHPGDPIKDGADALGLSAPRLRSLLGCRAALHPARRPVRQRYTDEQILQHIRTWAKEGSTSAVVYRTAAEVHQGWPSMATVTMRFGTWVQALQAADLAPSTKSGGRGRVWTNEQLAAVVATYFAEANQWSFRGLGLWLAARESGPSLSLVRKRLGTWPTLTKLATRTGPNGHPILTDDMGQP
jgi:hypothetical protein